VRRGAGDPSEVLAIAERLLRRADPATAGLWPRASALLALQALEDGLARLWERSALDLRCCSTPTQLICLRTTLDDPKLAARAGHAWSALQRACHHHAYELAPTAGELEAWFPVVRDLIGASASSPLSPAP
jgi:hypothetical protein